MIKDVTQSNNFAHVNYINGSSYASYIHNYHLMQLPCKLYYNFLWTVEQFPIIKLQIISTGMQIIITLTRRIINSDPWLHWSYHINLLKVFFICG